MKQDQKLVVFGEILMRLQTHRHERLVQADEFEVYYTGAETNVAVSVANYGLESYVVTKIPATEVGQACINHIRRFGVNIDYIVRGGSRLGIFYSESGASLRPSKIIYDRDGSAITELQVGDIPWESILKGKDWFHFTGITPALGDSVADVTQEASEIANRLGIKVSCDLNYRSKLWSREKARRVMTGLLKYVDVLFCNEQDADDVFGIKAKDTDLMRGELDVERYKDVTRELLNRFGLELVAITLRESESASINYWSALLHNGKDCFKSRRYKINVVDRVGGGDSFAGGLIYALLTKMEPNDALEFATAASCLKHTIHGDFNLVSIEEVASLLQGDRSGRIQR